MFNKKHDTCYDIIREFLNWIIEDCKAGAYSKDVPDRKYIYHVTKEARRSLRSKRKPSSDTSDG